MSSYKRKDGRALVTRPSFNYTAEVARCWEDLANAVVIEAVRDIQEYNRKYESGKHISSALESSYASAWYFFDSEYYTLFTDIHKDTLLGGFKHYGKQKT